MGIGGQPFGTSDNSGGSGDMGINQLTGDVTAGPGNGSQVATIGANKVTTAKIANGAVTEGKLADDAVTTDKLADDAVTNDKIFPEAVDIFKMAPDSVGPNQLIDKAVGFADKLQNTVGTDGSVLGSTAPGNVVELPFLAPARSIGAAATVADVRTVLGIRDIGDFRNWAIAQAKQRLALSTSQYPQTIIDEPFIYKPGQPQNVWNSLGGAAVSAFVYDLNAGWARLSNTGGGGATAYAYLGGFPPIGIASAFGAKWYLAFYGRLTDGVIEDGSRGGFEFQTSGLGAVGVNFPVNGSASVTKFSIMASNGLDFDLSNVDIDDQVHLFEVWGGGGDSDVFLAVDGEGSPANVAEGNMADWVILPLVTGSNGELGNVKFDYGHFVLLIAGNT